MVKNKVSVPFEVEVDQKAWLEEMAKKHGLVDPSKALRVLLDRIARTRPFALYLHPWECVPELPRARLGPVESFVTYLNLPTVLDKLERLLRRYRFVPMREALEAGGHLERA